MSDQAIPKLQTRHTVVDAKQQKAHDRTVSNLVLEQDAQIKK